MKIGEWMEGYKKSGKQNRLTLKGIKKAYKRNRNTKAVYLLKIMVKLWLITILSIGLYFGSGYFLKIFKDNKADLTAIEVSLPAHVETVAKEEFSEIEPSKERSVDGINITGLSLDDARERIINSYNWSMKAEYNGQQADIENLLSDSIDILTNDIFSKDKYGIFELILTNVEILAEEKVAALALKWDIKAKNAQITEYDKVNDEFIYSGEVHGVAINQEKLVNDLVEAVKGKKYDAVIKVETISVVPDISLKQAKELYKEIGTFVTITTDDSNRNNNIKIATDALNGLIIQPGDVFSFNNTTGNRTEEAGYKPAGAYRNGLFVKEPGGGVCQVSSTLYNAVIFSGLKMTERNAHTYEPSYVNPGEDAMVSYDGYSGPDMKFINQSDTAVAIRSTFDEKSLKFSIFGIPILEEGVTVSMQSEKIKDLPPPEPTYQEVKTLQPGIEEIVKEAINGSQWVTNLIIKKDGEIISNEYFHISNYRGNPAIINRNTLEVTPVPKKEKSEEE